ncbi:hypothetical protein DH2020_029523 [Rehmannia glutinosa]|uniref:Uncharacterized protein n=1 Tax=Rehmannia glutinosa TaxID=99300 RepID=A0ABR0VQT8_REHGL
MGGAGARSGPPISALASGRLFLHRVSIRESGIMLSPEDVAWADSCLSKDPDMLDSGWNSLKDALLETLSTQNHSSPYDTDNSTEGSKTEIFSKVDTGDVPSLDKTTVNITANSVGAEELNRDGGLNNANTDDFWSSHKIEDVFLPTYNENLRDLGVSEPEVDLVFQASDLEQSTNDIFKVWDLDIPPEEDDDLIKQLDKALSENPKNSVSDESKAWRGLQDDESLDDLISGIADLALSPKSG